MKCPSCGLEIPDDVEICPYCTAHVKRRVRIKSIYIVALVLIIVSATYATLAYADTGVPVRSISSLGVDDNYRFVHVRGTVVGYPYAYETPYGVTQIGFTISDGTGKLTVKIYSNQVQEAVRENKVPALGDKVDVEGTFSYSSRKSLSVNDVYLLNVHHQRYRDVDVHEIADASPWSFESYTAVSFTGNVTGVRQYSFGDIATVDGQVDYLIPRAYLSLHMLDLKKLASGKVKFYGSLLYYRPAKPSSEYQEVNLSKVMENPEAYNRTNIRVPWALVLARDVDNNMLTVSANGTNITVYTRYASKIYVGSHVEIQGRFVNYHGVWEISAVRKTDYVVTPGWEVVAHPDFKIIEEKSYGSLPAPVNSLVELDGVVADARPLGTGMLLTLWSNNTSYPVYVEDEGSIHGTIGPGAHVVVKGMVTMYRNEIEIKVRAYTLDSVEVKS